MQPRHPCEAAACQCLWLLQVISTNPLAVLHVISTLLYTLLGSNCLHHIIEQWFTQEGDYIPPAYANTPVCQGLKNQTEEGLNPVLLLRLHDLSHIMRAHLWCIYNGQLWFLPAKYPFSWRHHPDITLWSRKAEPFTEFQGQVWTHDWGWPISIFIPLAPVIGSGMSTWPRSAQWESALGICWSRSHNTFIWNSKIQKA